MTPIAKIHDESCEKRSTTMHRPCDRPLLAVEQGMALSFVGEIITTSVNRHILKPDKVSLFRKALIMSQPLDQIPDVDIDSNGVFKYILVHVHDDNNKQSKPIVRGYARSQWHADIYDEIGNELKKFGPGLDTECVGGGRINHNAQEKSIKVYGYSQGFGKADHQVSVNLLKKKYPEYDINWSDEGY